jgi:hypothetical protein
VIVVDISCQHHRLFEIVVIAVTILEPDKGMVIAEQRLQLLRCAAGTHIGISAVLGITALPGVVYRYLHGFGFVIHFFHLLLSKNGHKKSTAATIVIDRLWVVTSILSQLVRLSASAKQH